MTFEKAYSMGALGGASAEGLDDLLAQVFGVRVHAPMVACGPPALQSALSSIKIDASAASFRRLDRPAQRLAFANKPRKELANGRGTREGDSPSRKGAHK